jgi:3-hydroxyisobutyrate dehydrogenase
MKTLHATHRPTVAFIGTGVMGQSMAGHLLEAGCRLSVFNRTHEKAAHLVNSGAVWCESPGDAASKSEVVITMLGYPEDVEAVYFGLNGVLDSAVRGALLIDMTTSSPELAKRIARAAEGRGLYAVDAPVSGGDVGAREARLAIMAGGSKVAFDRALPILQVMGKTIQRLGEAGAGQHCKMANQAAVAVGMLAWCEAMAYAKAQGLDPAEVQQVISGGAAGSWAMSNLAPRALVGDFAPGFYVKHMVKDILIALRSAHDCGLRLPGLEKALALFERAAAKGWQECGTQILYRLYCDQ